MRKLIDEKVIVFDYIYKLRSCHIRKYMQYTARKADIRSDNKYIINKKCRYCIMLRHAFIAFIYSTVITVYLLNNIFYILELES